MRWQAVPIIKKRFWFALDFIDDDPWRTPQSSLDLSRRAWLNPDYFLSPGFAVGV